MRVLISEVVVDPLVQIRDRLDEGTVERYVESFDALPPVDIFRVAPGPLLADGFHRLEAARRLGRIDIEAVEHQGTWDDASAFAVTANTKHGHPLTRTERNEGINRLLDLGWTETRIAAEMGIAQTTVSNIARGRVLRASLPPEIAQSTKLTDTHLYRIARVPEEQQAPLARAVVERGWSEPETREAVKTLNDPAVSETAKAAVLAGADVRGAQRAISEAEELAKQADPYYVWTRAATILDQLDHFTAAEIAASFPADWVDWQVSHARHWAGLLTEVAETAERKRGRLEVVS